MTLCLACHTNLRKSGRADSSVKCSVRGVEVPRSYMMATCAPMDGSVSNAVPAIGAIWGRNRI